MLFKKYCHWLCVTKGMPPARDWASKVPLEEYFMECMADSGKVTCDHFGKRIVFINVMRRISVDCDCAGVTAAEPTMKDIMLGNPQYELISID